MSLPDPLYLAHGARSVVGCWRSVMMCGMQPVLVTLNYYRDINSTAVAHVTVCLHIHRYWTFLGHRVAEING